MKYGSYDYLQKPFKLSVLKIIIDRILEAKKLKQEKIVLKTRVKDRHRLRRAGGASTSRCRSSTTPSTACERTLRMCSSKGKAERARSSPPT